MTSCYARSSLARLLPVLAVLVLTVTTLPVVVATVEPCCADEGAQDDQDQGCAGGSAACACCAVHRVVEAERLAVAGAPVRRVALAAAPRREPTRGAIREVLHVPKSPLG